MRSWSGHSVRHASQISWRTSVAHHRRRTEGDEAAPIEIKQQNT